MDLPPAFPESIPEDDIAVCGGIIVFGGNLVNITPTLNRLQKKAALPLLVGADLERGLGQQVMGGCNFPHARGLGEQFRITGDASSIYGSALQTAQEARQVGIHQNYAPVADVDTNPDNSIIGIRSFGSDSETVGPCVKAYIDGLREGNMLATAKHFPGHGDTRADSHIELPSLNLSAEVMNKVHLAPFQDAITAGVDAIMVGHLSVPALDPSCIPSSLSSRLIGDILRKRMGFNGIVITDAMNMGGITSRFSPDEAVIRAIKAGVDQVLMPGSASIIQAVESAVRSGELDPTLIDEAVERILRVKERLGLFENNQAAGLAASSEMLPRELARRCLLTLRGSIKPIRAKPQVVFCLMKPDGMAWLREKIGSFANVEVFSMEDQPPQDRTADTLVVISDVQPRAWAQRTGFSPAWREAINKLFVPGDVLVSFGSPGTGEHLDKVQNFVCTYSSSPEAQEAIYSLLFDDR